MELKEAIQLLKDHNIWRRYDGEIPKMDRTKTEQEFLDYCIKKGKGKLHIAMDLLELITDFIEVDRQKQLLIQRVVFNEATTNNKNILDEPRPLYEDYDIEVKSEVELKCVWCETNQRYQHMGICKECFDKYPM